MEVEDILEFRKLENTSIENVDVPTRPENRHVTDITGFILFLIFFIVFMTFFILTLLKSDTRRFVYVYDDCGNMCGQLNKKIEGVSCSGKDYRNKEWYYRPNKSCVDKCPDGTYKTYIPKICKNEVINEETTEEISGSWWTYVLIISLAIVVSFLLIIALRYFTAVTVWSAIILSLLILCAISCYYWYLYASESSNNITMAVYCTGLLVVYIIIFLMCRKHMPLVIQLFKVATEALFAMPCLIGLPLLSLLVQSILWGACICTNIIFLMTAGEVKQYGEGATFQSYDKSIIAVVLNVFMTVWAMVFWSSFMYMSLAGAVAAWFFAKNRQDLRFPICTSMCIVFKYHLGTLALGSFITVIAMILQTIVNQLSQDNYLGCLIRCCCQCIMDILEYLKKRAYIETAIHGEPFCKSGKRAAILLLNHFGPAVYIFVAGSRVLFMIQCFAILISGGIGWLLFPKSENLVIQFTLALVLSGLVTAFIITLINDIVDVLFICFCEDQVINNGGSRPYCMPKNLMQFVDTTKKVYETRAAEASSTNTNRT